MESAATLTLAGLCLGIALSGMLAALLRQGHLRERRSLGVVYLAFTGMIALPFVQTRPEIVVINYMPLLLVLLLALPPAFYHYIVAKTDPVPPLPVPWRDLILPVIGSVVCLGFWTLPTQTKSLMFIAGDLPPGLLPAMLALVTFALILLWPFVSLAYLVAMVRRLAAYRARLRDLYSNVDLWDLRWVDGMMILLVLIWTSGALSLADENLGSGDLFMGKLFLTLIAVCLLVLNIFAPLTPPETQKPVAEGAKYARSALTREYTQKLAARIETAMAKDALYLDPNLSLQTLAQHVGALPNQVSQTLNQEIGATFFDYVARWRITASKPMIAAGDDSVLTIALDVGFNSRSTFYKAFNRETGMTPKAYRAAHQATA